MTHHTKMDKKDAALDLDEIDLLDCVRIIKRRKKTVLALVLLSAAISVVVIVRSPKIYEAQATIKIGSVITPIINSSEAVLLMRSLKIISSAVLRLEDMDSTRLKVMFDRGDIIPEVLENANLIKLSVKNRDPLLAAKIANTVAESFVLEGHKRYGQNKLMLEGQIRDYQIYLDYILERNGRRAVLIPADLRATKGPVKFGEAYSTTFNRMSFLKEQLLKAHDFEIFDPAITPIRPLSVKEKAVKMFLYAFILGLFLIFIQESRIAPNKHE